MTTPETTAEQKAAVGAQNAALAPKKALSKKKASPKKATLKGKTKAIPEEPNPKRLPKAGRAEKAATLRPDSKGAKVLELIGRPKGAVVIELVKATGWQAHSIRGFISGTLGTKMGLTVTSAKREDGERAYSIIQ
jgi:Protein of unknown function (DUF3489)